MARGVGLTVPHRDARTGTPLPAARGRLSADLQDSLAFREWATRWRAQAGVSDQFDDIEWETLDAGGVPVRVATPAMLHRNGGAATPRPDPGA